MTIDEIEIGQEVICTKLRDKPKFGQTAFRGQGHIGKVISVFPMDEIAFIGHLEYDGELYKEFLTAYHLDELKIYSAPERVLQNAIKSLKESLID